MNMNQIDPRFKRQLPRGPDRMMPKDYSIILDFEIIPLQQEEVIIDSPA